MNGLVIGIDLCDSCTQICCFEKEKVWNIPALLSKKKNTEEWSVSESAAFTQMGDEIIADKLLSLVIRGGSITLEGRSYKGEELLKIYLKKILQILVQETHEEKISQLVISLQSMDPRLISALRRCAVEVAIPKERLHIISRSESFIYYVMTQKKEIWNNQVGLFDLAEDSLHYYELKAQRDLKQMTVVSEFNDLKEGFSLDILNTASGSRLADKILCSCAERLLDRKLYSAIFLTGIGFAKQEWAAGFMKMVCTRRKVYVEHEIYCRGAAWKGADLMREKTVFPFQCICDGRLRSTVSMRVRNKDKESQLILASAGDIWYETMSTADLILDHQNELELFITPMDPKKRRQIKFPLEGFPVRPGRTTRISVGVKFSDEKTMEVIVKDKGFGELFPSSDAMVRQEVML